MHPLYAVVLIAWFLVALGLAGFFAVRERQRLAAIGEFLRGGSDFRSAWGSALGVRATLRWSRGRRGDRRRNDRRRWTEITAELPDKLPFVMALRPQGWLDRQRADRGSLVDVEVGDGAFDAAYVIEAAPAEVVRALLTPARRAALAGYGKIRIITEQGPLRLLRLRIPAVLDDLPAARPALELAVELATGVREAYAAVEAAADVQLVGAPFREHRESSGEQEAALRRVDEVRQLEAKRAVGVAPMVLLSVALWLVALVGLIRLSQLW